MRPRIETKEKPIKGHIIEADFFRWPTIDPVLREPTGRHIICVTGYTGRVSFSNSLRTSWVENVYETPIGRFIETRNSIYRVDMKDTSWKVLQDEMKHENLDVEKMRT